MADWPITSHSRVESSVASGDHGIQVTSGGTANTKGPWTQLVASTSVTSHTLVISIVQFTDKVPILFDIGVGAAGSEVVVVPNLFVRLPNRTAGGSISIPLTIPAGSRVSVRSASSSASAIGWVSVTLIGGGFPAPPGFSNVTAYGAVPASSRGTQIDPGTSFTKGAWVELTAATTTDVHALAMMVAPSTTTYFTGHWMLDVGVGAAGSERIILPDLLCSNISTTTIPPGPVCWSAVPTSIPAGSRLAVRAVCSSSGAGRFIDAVLYGLS